MGRIYKEEIFTCFECKHSMYLKQFGICCTRMEETDDGNDVILDNFPEIPDNCPLDNDDDIIESLEEMYDQMAADHTDSWANGYADGISYAISLIKGE
jgi:hypothetical protein